MTAQLVGNAAGGIGLFLLGMMLMTDGLKLAAGQALRHILREWTRTPLRGFFSGILITSLVQSSSAVTVATIGFVNAGLLGLLETVYVIFGSNVGTTMTGWLVAVIGFKVDVKALALPLIALGMLLKLVGGDKRRAALGTALAGFGLFFLGIDILKATFEGLGRDFPMAEWARGDLLGMVAFVGIGFLLTLLMQSSSAAMAVTLTAAAGAVIPLSEAAAMVIGANLGTTSTAALAVIGATANAKRVAAAHVLFNLLTGVVAIVFVGPLLVGIDHGLGMVGVRGDIPMLLALFHTVFNMLGVVLMWRLTPRLVATLEARFRGAEEDLGRPRFLDRNIVTTPSLAMDALINELSRVGELARGLAKGALSSEGDIGQRLEEDRGALQRLVEAVNQFTVEVQRSNISRELGDNLPNAIRVARYYQEAAELANQVAMTQRNLAEVRDSQLAEQMAHFRSACVAIIGKADPASEEFCGGDHEQRLEELKHQYQAIKALLLRSGASDRIPVRQMVAQLDQYSAIRRMLEQVLKGGHYLCDLTAVAARYREPAVTPEVAAG